MLGTDLGRPCGFNAIAVASRGKAAADSVPRTCPQNLQLERRAGANRVMTPFSAAMPVLDDHRTPP